MEERTNSTTDWNNIWEAAAVARKTCREAYFVSKAFSENSSTNPSQFIKYVNKTKNSGNIGVTSLYKNRTIVIHNVEKVCLK